MDKAIHGKSTTGLLKVGRLSVRSRLGSFKVFISAKGLYLSIGSEIAGLIADSVSKGLFSFIVQFKKFPKP